MGPLTKELDDKESPVRQFLDERFTSGLREVQRRYRTAAPGLVVPGVPRDAANPGTVGTAADWLLRFLLHPRPSLQLASLGAVLCGRQAGLTGVLVDIAAIARQGIRRIRGDGQRRFHRSRSWCPGGPGALGPRVLVPGALD